VQIARHRHTKHLADSRLEPEEIEENRRGGQRRSEEIRRSEGRAYLCLTPQSQKPGPYSASSV
jgi:hypothetical protein